MSEQQKVSVVVTQIVTVTETKSLNGLGNLRPGAVSSPTPSPNVGQGSGTGGGGGGTQSGQ